MAARSRPAFSVRAALVAATVAAGPGCGRQGGTAAPPPLPALPRLALSPDQAAAVTRLELTRPDDDEPTRRSVIVLERTGSAWRLSSPLRAPASADKVAALLANLQDLYVWKRLDAGTSFYERYDLTDAKALHVVAETASHRRVADFFAGKSSEQGQLIRLPGRPGLFALVNQGPHGYQGFLYARDLRSWREPQLWSFDEAEVQSVEIANPHGSFLFTRRDGGWDATRTPPPRAGGAGGSAPAGWARFDGRRVDELLHAYHALAADDFGTAAQRAASGVDGAERTGGAVRIHLRHTPAPLVLRVGRPAAQDSRFAIAGSRWAVVGEGKPGQDGDALYALSPWTARWATADARLFERAR